MPLTSASVYDVNGILTDRKLLSISTLIGDRYPVLASRLGLSGDQLIFIKASSPGNLQHQVFHMLDLWRQMRQTEATLETLNQCLVELGWTSVMTQIRTTPDNFYVVT